MNNEAQTDVNTKSIQSELFDWLEVFVLSITIVFTLFTFILRIAVVDGSSMVDTLHHGEPLIISELFYTPKRGDIIVFQKPGVNNNNPLVKRIIATEGDTVEIDFDEWVIKVNGEIIDEPYLNKLERPMTGWAYGDSYTVPEGCLFVLGDNRVNSSDSRSTRVGAVDTRYIIGKVIMRLNPLTFFN
ncbi:MAG: signal peptidase I [Firmicutes bacterium]|nr:signal peptidase I [Bacillota bacterium]